MTASAFLYSWALLKRESLSYHKNGPYVGTFIRIKPLRSPMSIFSKSPDLEKCEAGSRE